MTMRALQDFTYYSKYARYSKEKRRRETWAEAVDRMKQMHLKKFPQIGSDIEWAFDLVEKKRLLASQRSLQFAGAPIEAHHARQYNCSASYCDRIRFFQEVLYLLLAGCGTGFSVQKHHIAKLPSFDSRRINARGEKLPDEVVFTIPDSIEGWADALGVLMASYFPHPEFGQYAGKEITFDYTKIRPAGSPISSGVGKAPGPVPLRRSIETIRNLMNRCLREGKSRLAPIDAYDIVMHASDAVLSGGVRRSATLALFSVDDEEMAKAKTGNWQVENPQRARSNNSAMLVREEATREQFMNLIASVKEFGEPGFYFGPAGAVPNPCFHRDTRIATDAGLMRIGDLYEHGGAVNVVVDGRVGKGDEFSDAGLGTRVVRASRVMLTQKNAEMFRMVTKHGHSIVATANHEFPTNRGRIPLSEIREGDVVYLQSGEGGWGSSGSYNEGILLGLITGDGCFSHNGDGVDTAFVDLWEDDFDIVDDVHDIVTEAIDGVETFAKRQFSGCLVMDQPSTQRGVQKKRIGGVRLYRAIARMGIEDPRSIKERVPEVVWRGSRDMVRGYLAGLIATDGSVQLTGEGSGRTLSIRLTQAKRRLLEDVQVLLQNFGISSRIYLRREAGMAILPDGNGGVLPYKTKDVFELIISRPGCIRFRDEVGIFGHKNDTLNRYLDDRGLLCRKPDLFRTKIVSIEPCGNDDVFCLNQPETNSVVANGIVAGNCVEISQYPVDVETGESGWQGCNLTTINGTKIKTKDDFATAVRAATIIGTIQAAYTSFPYLGKTTEKIFAREALLGISISGMMDNPDLLFDAATQREMAKLAVAVNEEFAKKIGINPAARLTCVKPDGNSSCVLGSASGTHPHHAKRYFRRVQCNTMDPIYKLYESINPTACEKSVWNKNGTDDVVTFCIEVPDGSKTKNDLRAIDLLKYVRTTQQNWVKHGTVEKRCTLPGLMHNVSNTINVGEDEWEEVAQFIWDNREWFSGVSLLPLSGDLDYAQAPYCNVLTPREILAEYGDCSLMASGLIVDGLRAFDDNLWNACDAAMGMGASINGDEYEKIDWMRRVKQFANRYLDGSVKKCCRLMKHVNNWKLWVDLLRETRDVDYTTLVEDEDNTSAVKEWACAGGKCEVA